MHDALETIREALSLTAQHTTGYDWNTDPLGLTAKQAWAFELIEQLQQAVRPDNPKPQTFGAAMMAYEGACLALNRALADLADCLDK